jgi:hypothetical protein
MNCIYKSKKINRISLQFFSCSKEMTLLIANYEVLCLVDLIQFYYIYINAPYIFLCTLQLSNHFYNKLNA